MENETERAGIPDPGTEEDRARIVKLDGSESASLEDLGLGGIDGDDQRLDTPGGEPQSSLGEKPERKPRKPRADSGKPRTGRRGKKEDLAVIRQRIIAWHQIGASMAGIPEVAVSEQEAEFLAADVLAVLEQYDFSIDPKLQAWLNLAMTASAIYVPHFMIYAARKKAERLGAQRMAEAQSAAVQKMAAEFERPPQA